MQKNGWVVTRDGRRMHYKDGLLHREDGPVLLSKDGKKLWYSETDGLVSWIPAFKQKRPEPPSRPDQKQTPAQTPVKEDPMSTNAQITPSADELLKKTVVIIDILEQAKKLGILVKVVKRRDIELMYYFQDPDNDTAFSGVEMPVDIRSMCGEENAAKFDACSMAVTKMIASRSTRLMASIRQKLTADEKSILGI